MSLHQATNKEAIIDIPFQEDLVATQPVFDKVSIIQLKKFWFFFN